MWASASWSRWPVDTPGFSSASTRARTSATILPARRMRSISARDLRVTMSGHRRGAARAGFGDGSQEVGRDLLDRPEAVHDPQQTGFVVVVGDLAEAGELLVQPGADGLGPVVLALDEGGAVQVAGPGDLRR